MDSSVLLTLAARVRVIELLVYSAALEIGNEGESSLQALQIVCTFFLAGLSAISCENHQAFKSKTLGKEQSYPQPATETCNIPRLFTVPNPSMSMPYNH